MIIGLCLAVGLAIVLIVRMNSGPAVPTQVLDIKNAPVSPPPSVDELKYDRHAATPSLDPNTAQKKPGQAAANAPTVVRVPVPAVAGAKKPLSKREWKQMAVSTGDTHIAASPKASAASPSSAVQVLTDPPGASVTVDARNSCRTPCLIQLASGRHTLAANLDGFATSRKIFHVPEDVSVFVPMTRSLGVLMVSSDPSGANVDVDGKAAGTTPVTLRLPPGAHRVSVWDGERWHDDSIVVAADEVHTRAFRF